jgi:hypothetical protein
MPQVIETVGQFIYAINQHEAGFAAAAAAGLFRPIEVEPTVRIGWSKLDFWQNHTPMPKQTQLTLSVPTQTISNPLTEGFTETRPIPSSLLNL